MVEVAKVGEVLNKVHPREGLDLSSVKSTQEAKAVVKENAAFRTFRSLVRQVIIEKVPEPEIETAAEVLARLAKVLEKKQIEHEPLEPEEIQQLFIGIPDESLNQEAIAEYRSIKDIVKHVVLHSLINRERRISSLPSQSL